MNTQTPFFTVVVVACNVEKYIAECLNSVKNQSFKDFELLAMCEKSNDNTLSIIREELKAFPQNIVFDLPCTGSASEPRNIGQKQAKGKYILFIDGDDWIELDALERFYQKICKTSYPDLIWASANEYTEAPDGSLSFCKKWSNLNESHEAQVFSGLDAVAQIDRDGKLPAIVVWLSCYRKDFLLEHELYQVKGLRFEDDEWSPRVWYYAKTVTFMPYCFYNYRRRAGSITTAQQAESFFDKAFIINNLIDFFLEKDMPPATRKSYLSHIFFLLFWHFYNPGNKQISSKHIRNKALASILKHQGCKRYFQLSKYASPGKKISRYLLLPYWLFGSDILLSLYLRSVYYPTINKRMK